MLWQTRKLDVVTVALYSHHVGRMLPQVEAESA